MKAFRKIYMSARSVVGNLGLALLGGGLAITTGLAIFTAACHFMASASEPWGGNVSEPVFKAASESTVTLRSVKKTLPGGGQAFKPSDGEIYLTVEHVAKSAADLPIRGRFPISVEGADNIDNEETLAAYGCLHWVDVCALGLNDSLPQLFNGRFHESANLQVGTGIFLVRPKMDRNPARPLSVGTVTEVTPLSIVARLGVRPGYSGSPVFSMSGEFVGLAVRANNYGINTANLVGLLQLPSYKVMQTTVEILPASAIRRLAPCFALGAFKTTACLDAQADLLIDQLDYKIRAPGNRLLKLQEIDTLLKSFNQDFLAQLAVVDDSATATNYRTLSALAYLQPGSQRRFERLKEIQDDRLANLCSVLAPFYLGEDAKSLKDTVTILASLKMCQDMATKPEPMDGFRSRWVEFVRSHLPL